MKFLKFQTACVLSLFCLIFINPLAQSKKPVLVDITRESGIAGFKNVQGGITKKHIIETMGGGAAFLDYDNDGNLDLLLVRGSTVEHFMHGGGDVVCALYRGDGHGHFQEVTAAAGITARGWGMGVAVGDIDNDGREDIYITCYGPNKLFHNMGDGKFEEIARNAGLEDPRWSVGASFADVDHDGDLDLYVANYLVYDLENLPQRSAPCSYRGFDVFCGPRGLPGSRDALYINDGKGHFKDVSAERNIDPESLYGMGTAIADYDNDGWPDIFVANDLTPNLLYHNLGKGKFEEVGVSAGIAFDENGVEEGTMGGSFGDFNNDGWPDLYYTNSSYETNQLCVNNKNGTFSLKSYELGHGESTWLYVGWGNVFADLDNDGWEDIFVVNGHLYPEADRFDMGLKYRQHPLIFMNLQGRMFKESSADWGSAVNQPANSRGLAYGDIDHDGDLDLLINNQDGPPILLRNDGGNRNHWLMVHCIGRTSNRLALGTRLIARIGTLQQTREIQAGQSYASTSDLRVHFGLGGASLVNELEIRWPSGKVEKRVKLKSDQFLVVEEPD